jgi:3-phosphoglycerate kinase
MISTRVFYSLDDIKRVVEDLMPPAHNKYIGDFKLIFKMSYNSWEATSNFLILHLSRGVEYIVERASLQEEIDYLSNFLDKNYEYSDDHKYWKSQVELREKIRKLEDENKIWLLQNLSNKSSQF